jgi:hypothetical protein
MTLKNDDACPPILCSASFRLHLMNVFAILTARNEIASLDAVKLGNADFGRAKMVDENAW